MDGDRLRRPRAASALPELDLGASLSEHSEESGTARSLPTDLITYRGYTFRVDGWWTDAVCKKVEAMALEYRKIATVLESLRLTRKQFYLIHHVDEDPRAHVKYLRGRTTEEYGCGRNEETALRVVLIAALLIDHGYSADQACELAARAMPVRR
jgi:hypothetical protein